MTHRPLLKPQDLTVEQSQAYAHWFLKLMFQAAELNMNAKNQDIRFNLWAKAKTPEERKEVCQDVFKWLVAHGLEDPSKFET